jgi:hypothetical protein
MKKTLLLAILALSINAFAQTCKPTLNPTSNIRKSMELAGRMTFKAHADMNLREAFKLKTPDQGSLVQIFDSVHGWDWDTLTNGWRMYFKSVDFVYDANNNLSSEIDQTLVGTTWVNSTNNMSTFDTRHNLINYLVQTWNNNAWVNSRQYVYTFDANNNLTNELLQSWKGSSWGNLHQHIYTYDANNNKTSEVYQSWISNAWVNAFKYVYTYDANNNQTSELDQQWNNNAWADSEEYTYTYDVNNKRVSCLAQIWTDSAWNNSTQINYTYDASGNLKIMLYNGWNGSSWNISFQSIFTYDDHNNQTSQLDQQLRGSTWANFDQELYNYDADNFQKSSSWKDWNMTGTEVAYGDSSYYYYHTVLGINNLKIQDEGITVYPNPTSGRFTISSKTGINDVEVYDIQGRQVYSGVNFNEQKSAKIDLSGYSKGIYIMNVRSGAKIYNYKIVVQ